MRGNRAASHKCCCSTKSHIAQAFGQGDDDYISEVAGTLRILVSEAHANKPLLLNLMRQYDTAIRWEEEIITILPGAEGMRIGVLRIRGCDRIETITWMAKGLEIGWMRFPAPPRSTILDEYLASFSNLQSGPAGTPAPVTKIALIQTLANQYGGAHEDPGIELHLAYALNGNLHLNGRLAYAEVLRRIAGRVAWVADQFLSHLAESRPDLFG